MNPELVWHVLYPLYHRIKNDHFFKHLNQLKTNETLTLQELQQVQSKKLQRLIHHAYQTTAFYREKIDSLGIDYRTLHLPENFCRLPMLTKQDINSDRKRMLSGIMKQTKIKPNSTSGSTGEKLEFYNDFECLSTRMAAGVRYNQWLNIHPGERIATLWGAPMDMNKGKAFRGRLHAFFTNSMLLSSYDLDDKTMALYERKLNAFKPRLLISYPGPLTVFAEYLIRKQKTIPSLKAIVSSAETLFDWQRQTIQNAFPCRLYNRYGCREFGNLAHECDRQNGLHVSIDRVYLEILDESGRSAGPGKTGEIVITDLDNYGMPFLRYRIGDMGSIKPGNCLCGRPFPLLNTVEGRTLDIVRAENGARLGGTFWTLLFRSKPGFKQFQVIQNEISGIKVNYIPDPDARNISFDFFTQKILRKCGANFRVEYQQVEDIPKTGSGKTRFIISRLKNR